MISDMMMVRRKRIMVLLSSSLLSWFTGRNESWWCHGVFGLYSVLFIDNTIIIVIIINWSWWCEGCWARIGCSHWHGLRQAISAQLGIHHTRWWWRWRWFWWRSDDDKKWLSKEQSQPAVGPRWIANSQNVHTTCHHHHYFHNNHHSDDDAQDKRCQAEAFKTVWRASALHNPLDRPRHDDDDDDGDDDDDDTNYDNDDDTLGGRNPPWRGLSWTSSPDVFSPTTQFSNGPTLLMLRNVLF